MTAATIDQAFVEGSGLAVEHALIDAGNAQTYVSKMSKPLFCQLTIREDIDADVNYTLSGRTFTIHESGGAGIKLAISVYGYL